MRKHKDLYLPDSVRERFTTLGYRCLDEKHPGFGGIILFLHAQGGHEEAAYYIAKRSTFELVSSDELRRALEFVEERGSWLHYVVTASKLSPGASQLAIQAGISLLPPYCGE